LVGDFRTQRKNEIASAIHLYYPDGVLRRTMGFKMRFCLGENIKEDILDFDFLYYYFRILVLGGLATAALFACLGCSSICAEQTFLYGLICAALNFVGFLPFFGPMMYYLAIMNFLPPANLYQQAVFIYFLCHSVFWSFIGHSIIFKEIKEN